MKQMLHFEWKKLCNKSILFFLVAFFVLNIVYIFSNYRAKDGSLFQQGYDKIYNEVRGSITQEKLDFIFDGYQRNAQLVNEGKYDTETIDPETYSGYVYGDMSLFQEFYEDIIRVIEYQDTTEDIYRKIEENITRSTNQGDIEYYQILQNTFQNRSIHSYYNTIGLESYITYHISTFLVLILMILGVTSVFGYENANNMYPIIETTTVGKRKLMLSKFLVCVFYTCGICVVFYGSDYIFFSIFNYIEGLYNPLYSLPSFNTTYFNITIGSYLVIQFLSRMIGCLLLSMVNMAIIMKIKNTLISLLINMLLIVFFWNQDLIFPGILLQIYSLFTSVSLIQIFNIWWHQVTLLLSGTIVLSCILGHYIHKRGRLY
jgi:hypothetical protein